MTAPTRRPRARRPSSGRRRARAAPSRAPRRAASRRAVARKLAIGRASSLESLLLATVEHELGRAPEELDEIGRSSRRGAAACRRPVERASAAASSGTPTPATMSPTARIEPGRGKDQRGRQRPTTIADDDRSSRRADAPQVEALQRIDVADHPAHEIAAAEALELSRRERLDALVEAGPGRDRASAARDRARRGGRGSGRAAARARRSGRATIVTVEREDRRLLRGAGDEVAGRGDQPDAEQHGQCRERDRERNAPPRHARQRAMSRPSVRTHAGDRHDPAAVDRDDRGRPGRQARCRARSAASSGRPAAARPPRPRSARSPGRGSRSARRERRAARRAGTRGRARCAGARRSRARVRLRRRPSRSRRADCRSTSSAPASTAASRTRSSDALGSPRRMLSATVPRNSVGLCGTQAICAAPGCRVARRRGRSSPTRIRPLRGAWKRSSSDASVLLPPPLGPTSATVSPGAISSETSASAAAGRSGIRRTRRTRTGSGPRAALGGVLRARGDRDRLLDQLEQPVGDRERRPRSRGTRPRGCGAAGRARARARAPSARARTRSRRRRAARPP